MKLASTVGSLAIFIVIAATGKSALAQSPAQPAGNWSPSTSTDAAHIVNNGYYIYNNDSSATHTIVSGAPVNFGTLPGLVSGAKTATFYGYSSNGLPFVCYINITDLVTHNTVQTSGVSSGTGYVPISVPYTVTNAVYTNPTVISTQCNIPKQTSGGVSFLFAGITTY